MQSKARVLSSLFAIVGCVVLTTLLVSATSCDRISTMPTPAPTATRPLVSTPAQTPVGTPAEPPVVEIPLGILSARDALLAFFRNQYPGKAPADRVVWTGRDTAPPGAVGISSYEFSGDGWVMTIAAVSVSSTEIVYEMGLDNPEAGLRWIGKLDATYSLLESNLNLAAEVLVARDTVLAYVRQNYTTQAPADNLAWIGERTTPLGMVGHETCQFSSITSGEAAAGGWKMTVEYDLAAPAQVVYKADLSQVDTGFVWHGQVDAEGTVLEHR